MTRSFFVLLPLAIACGTDGTDPAKGADSGIRTETDTDTDTDSGTDDPAEISWIADGRPAVAPPEIDWASAGAPPYIPPSRTCPSGWTEVAQPEGGHVCSPWPEGAREVCADRTSMHLPGELGCETVGSVCPAGDWPTDVVDAGTWFVVSGGTGDGTRDAPFGRIADAVAIASAGDTIVVGAGTFDEAVEVDRDLTIRGLCTSQTLLTLSGGGDEESGVVSVENASLTLRDLQIMGSEGVGVSASGGTLALEGVVIDGVANHGVSATDTAVAISDVLIEDVAPRPSDSANGDGVYVYGGSLVANALSVTEAYRVGIWVEEAPADVSDVSVWSIRSEVTGGSRGAAFRSSAADLATVSRLAGEDLQGYGIAATVGDLTVEDVWVVGVALDNNGATFGGIGAGPGTITVRGAYVSDVPGYGVHQSTTTNEGDLVIEDVVIDSVTGDYGTGVHTSYGPVTSISRTIVRDADGGMRLFATGSIVIADVVVSDTRIFGGIQAYGQGATTMSVERLLVDDTEAQGFLSYSLADVTLTDVAVRSPLSDNSLGVLVNDGACTVSRMVVDGIGYAGLVVSNPTSAVVEDIIVNNLSAQTAGSASIALQSWDYVPVSLSRASVTGGTGTGLEFSRVTATLEDIAVSGIASDTDGHFGLGLWSRYANVSVTRAAFDDVRYAGILSSTGDLALTDVVVSNVGQQACVADSCPTDTAASGIYVQADPQTEITGTLTQVLVDVAVGVGVQVDTASVNATNVLVRNSGVGSDVTDGGTYSTAGYTSEANGLDEGAGDQAKPSFYWGAEVPNDTSPVDGAIRLESGYYFEAFSGLTSDNCRGWYELYDSDVFIADLGPTEFTVTMPFGTDSMACVGAGPEVDCADIVTLYEYSADATLEQRMSRVLTITSTTSATETVTYSNACSGTESECAAMARAYGVKVPCETVGEAELRK